MIPNSPQNDNPHHFASETLAESEEKYRNIFENSFFAICILTTEGHLVDCNSRMPDLYRADSKEAFLNTTPVDVAPLYQPDGSLSAEKSKEHIQTALKKGVCDFDWLHKRFDETEFWAHVCLTKISVRGKDFIQSIIQDIDEAKRAQQQLKENEVRQKFIIKNAGLNMWSWNARTNLFAFTDDSSPPALPDFGSKDFTLEEFMTRCHPEDHEKTLVAWDNVSSGRVPAEEIEYRLRSPEGIWLWVQVNFKVLEYDKDGKPLTVIGCNKDIDQEKRAQEQLKQSEMRQKLAIENAGLTLWIWDMRTDIAKILNPDSPLAHFFPKEGILVYDQMLKNVHPDDQKAFLGDLDKLSNGTNVTQEREYRYKNPEGGWTWLKSNGTIAERDENGAPLISIGFHQDITDRKLYELQLLEAKKLTEEASRAKSEFLTNMSHEIRTPMTAILGYLDLLITTTERQEYAQTVRRNGMHLLDLINDILDLSKIEAGQIDLNMCYTQTISLIHNVVGPLEALAKEKGVLLAVNYSSEIPEKIWTDPRLLRQILWNIIGNAVKFTDEGQVRIEIAHLSVRQHERTKRKIQKLKIRVRDTGCGIPPEKLSAIFEPFVQADTTATRQFGGTGLGLAIALRQAKMLNGTIQAWNNLTGGATFEMLFPLEHTEDMKLIMPEQVLPIGKIEKKGKSISSTALEGVNVLLAEDGMDNQRLISTVLRKAGAKVDIANNGQEAIEMVQALAPKEYDLILMDMQMPILDGYAATSKLRHMKIDIPIIALTAHAMSGDRAKCLESGCDAYCPKPVRPNNLIDLISRYVRHKLT